MTQNIALLIIDPQIDFCDPNGALYVPEAEHDMARLANLVRRISPQINAINVTLDSHHLVHIANPIFWQNVAGKHPKPFTQISKEDVANGSWRAANVMLQDYALDYVQQLENNGNYQLTIWPPHCLIGSHGHAVASALYEALLEWEQQYHVVNYINKGSNVFTEHYSAIKADVPAADDPATQLNLKLIRTLERYDLIAIAGEARTHCVANTVRDIIQNLSNPDWAKKFVLLTDAMSDISGFENLAVDFMHEMAAHGVQFSTTENFLA